MSKLRLSLLCAVVFLLAGAIGGTKARAAEQDFTLVNDTGVTIAELYVSPTKSDEWGDNILGEDSLPSGKQAEINFSPAATAAVWDLKIADEAGSEIVWKGLKLTEISKVTLHYKDGKATADIE